MQLNLSDGDAELLVELLERALSDIREEIHRTDTREYRERLRDREAAMQRILDQARPASVR